MSDKLQFLKEIYYGRIYNTNNNRFNYNNYRDIEYERKYISFKNCNLLFTYFSNFIILVAIFSINLSSCSTKIIVGLYFKIVSSICSLVIISI